MDWIVTPSTTAAAHTPSASTSGAGGEGRRDRPARADSSRHQQGGGESNSRTNRHLTVLVVIPATLLTASKVIARRAPCGIGGDCRARTHGLRPPAGSAPDHDDPGTRRWYWTAACGIPVRGRAPNDERCEPDVTSRRSASRFLCRAIEWDSITSESADTRQARGPCRRSRSDNEDRGTRLRAPGATRPANAKSGRS